MSHYVHNLLNLHTRRLSKMNLILFMLPLIPTYGSEEHLSWVEEADETGAINMDIFFDRAVFLASSETRPIAPGVFISKYHVLTSYNPFRKLRNLSKPLTDLGVIVLTGRIVKPAGERNLHRIRFVKIQCARQVVPIPEKALSSKQWHGTDMAHSPLHDLMVIRLENYHKLKFLDPNSKYSFAQYSVGSSSYLSAGPIVTRVATTGDVLGRNVKFASLGFRDKKHILNGRVLSSKEYEIDDNVVEDCEEWMPKEWGYFICIRNDDHFAGVGSGALLVFEGKLYGIGSFYLKKGNHSILVFTDVRLYRHILFNTCILHNDETLEYW